LSPIPRIYINRLLHWATSSRPVQILTKYSYQLPHFLFFASLCLFQVQAELNDTPSYIVPPPRISSIHKPISNLISSPSPSPLPSPAPTTPPAPEASPILPPAAVTPQQRIQLPSTLSHTPATKPNIVLSPPAIPTSPTVTAPPVTVTHGFKTPDHVTPTASLSVSDPVPPRVNASTTGSQTPVVPSPTPTGAPKAPLQSGESDDQDFDDLLKDDDFAEYLQPEGEASLSVDLDCN